MEKPRLVFATGSALALFLILLPAITTTHFTVSWVQRSSHYPLDGDPSNEKSLSRYAGPTTVFVLLILILCGPFVWALNQLAKEGAMWGVHSSIEYSLDLLAPFVPGGHWRFAALTEPIWSRWTCNIHENSTYLGWTVIFLLAYTWRCRKEILFPFLQEWFWLMVVFFILALGPFLHVEGHVFGKIILPYHILEMAFSVTAGIRVPHSDDQAWSCWQLA